MYSKEAKERLDKLETAIKIVVELDAHRSWTRSGLNPGKPYFVNKLKELYGKSCSSNPVVAYSASRYLTTLHYKFDKGNIRGLHHAMSVYNKARLSYKTIEGYLPY